MRALKIVLIVALLIVAAATQTSAQGVVGHWQATISPLNKAGEKLFDTHFEFVVERSANGLRASLYNGSERMDFSSAEFSGDTLTLRLAQYDGTISTKFRADGTLAGDYSRQTSTGVRHYPLKAVKSAPIQGFNYAT